MGPTTRSIFQIRYVFLFFFPKHVAVISSSRFLVKFFWRDSHLSNDNLILLFVTAFYLTTEEKLDEFLQQLSDPESPGRSARRSPSRDTDDSSYYYLLQELASIMSGNNASVKSDFEVSKETNRLVWEASSVLSDSRPPSNLCVYDQSGAKTPIPGNENLPPIFDGSVANATPPPLGGSGAGASGGSGTILHLACAMDQPLILAFLLSMGADGRATHTAFRRLMIHEAACNGSIQCLQLLLEMGHKFAKSSETRDSATAASSVPFFPDNYEFSSSNSTSASRFSRFPPPIAISRRYFRRETAQPSEVVDRGDFLTTLRPLERPR